MRKRVLALVGAGLLVAACSHTDVQQHAAIDTTQKSIAVPHVKRGLLREIVSALSSSGWRLVADSTAESPQRKKGEARTAPPEQPQLAAAALASKARYRLAANARAIDYCHGGRVYIYDITITETANGAKVLEQSGRGCDRDIVQKFKEALTSQKQ